MEHLKESVCLGELVVDVRLILKRMLEETVVER
jgi:hypothetical protein